MFFGKLAVSDLDAKPLKASDNPIRGKERREFLARPKMKPLQAGLLHHVEDGLTKSIVWANHSRPRTSLSYSASAPVIPPFG